MIRNWIQSGVRRHLYSFNSARYSRIIPLFDEYTYL
jgi:hypothetical protein